MRRLLRNAVVFDGSRFLDRGGYVALDGRRITGVGEGEPGDTSSFDETIDCSGSSVLPGLIDAHVHLVWDGSHDPMRVLEQQGTAEQVLSVLRQAGKTLAAGITTVRDVGGPTDVLVPVARAARRGELAAPRIACAGAPIVMTGGHLHPIGLESDGPDAVRAAARRLLAAGVDLLKLMVTGGVYAETEQPGELQLTAEEIPPAVYEAHRRGRAVAAHAQGDEGIRVAVDAGVDSVEHGIFATEETLLRLAERGVFLVPTLEVMRRIARDHAVPDYAREKAGAALSAHAGAVRMAISMDVPIAVGTDMWSPASPPDIYRDELAALSELGLGVEGSLTAATAGAARLLRLDDLGRLEPGCLADLLVCRGDVREASTRSRRLR